MRNISVQHLDRAFFVFGLCCFHLFLQIFFFFSCYFCFLFWFLTWTFSCIPASFFYPVFFWVMATNMVGDWTVDLAEEDLRVAGIVARCFLGISSCSARERRWRSAFVFFCWVFFLIHHLVFTSPCEESSSLSLFGFWTLGSRFQLESMMYVY